MRGIDGDIFRASGGDSGVAPAPPNSAGICSRGQSAVIWLPATGTGSGAADRAGGELPKRNNNAAAAQPENSEPENRTSGRQSDIHKPPSAEITCNPM